MKLVRGRVWRCLNILIVKQMKLRNENKLYKLYGLNKLIILLIIIKDGYY